jgi:excisionase family DNA binding protein
MEDLLTTRQVLEILKVDRITVYRMLQDGRLKGVKIGQQWRFPLSEVERLVGEISVPETTPTEPNNTFPTHCVQTIQDLFSDVGQISALVVDAAGEQLTQISHACRFCQVMLQNPSGQAACRSSWKEIARQSMSGSRYFTCHAGLQYITAPIRDQEKPVGYFMAGQFYWQSPDSSEEADRIHRLTAQYALPADSLNQATRTVPVIPLDQHPQVETWPATAARAVLSILHERLSFMDRLQQIANLTQIP